MFEMKNERLPNACKMLHIYLFIYCPNIANRQCPLKGEVKFVKVVCIQSCHCHSLNGSVASYVAITDSMAARWSDFRLCRILRIIVL